MCSSGPVSLDPSTSIQCGGLTFDQFQIQAADPGTNAAITFLGGSVANSTVTLTFNPGLSGTSGPQDLWVYYRAAGAAVDSVQVGVAGGTSATVQDLVCGSPIARTGPMTNVCAGAPLANVAAFSAVQSMSAANASFSKPADTMYVFKDINVQNGGSLSDFTQSYHLAGTTSTPTSTPAAPGPGTASVPEPLTAGLMGGGLVLLGWLHRRISRTGSRGVVSGRDSVYLRLRS